MGAFGVVLTAADGFSDGSFDLGDGLTVAASCLSFVPVVGWAYGAADFGFGVITGTSLSRRIGNLAN